MIEPWEWVFLFIIISLFIYRWHIPYVYNYIKIFKLKPKHSSIEENNLPYNIAIKIDQ